jgi:hypothetical protein
VADDFLAQSHELAERFEQWHNDDLGRFELGLAECGKHFSVIQQRYVRAEFSL